MNLATLKATVAEYHEKEITDLTRGEVDLFLVAANNARKKAEKRHDFKFCQLRATLVVDGVNGGALEDAEITPEDKFASIRQISSIGGMTAGGRVVPLNFSSYEAAVEEDRTVFNAGGEWLDRTPADWEVEAFAGSFGGGIVQRGDMLFRYPGGVNTTTDGLVYIEGTGWLLDYTDAQLAEPEADPQDFFLEHGFEWLQWEIIMALNYKFQTFVPRQEGNVGSPQSLRDEAWRDLVVWDSYAVAANSTMLR